MTGGSVGWPAAGISVISTCILPAASVCQPRAPPQSPLEAATDQARISLRRLSLHTAPATPVALAPYVDQTFDLATLPARQEEPLENLGGKPVLLRTKSARSNLARRSESTGDRSQGSVYTRTQRVWWSM